MPTSLFSDSTGAISMDLDPVKHELSKHVGVDAFYTQTQVQDDIVSPQYVFSEIQLADLFTKAQTGARHRYEFCISGPKELTGAEDLISKFKLHPHHDFFCKKPLPLAISDTYYLHNVVGDTEIRKGEGMELDQLVQNAYLSDKPAYIQPFDMETLGQAFQLRETAPVDLPSAEKGIPTISGKSRSESKDKEKKHRKHKDKDKEKDREHKKHKHRHKDRSKDKDRDKDKKKDKSGHHDSGGDHSKKHHEKKRKHDGPEESTDVHKHKKSKAPTSEVLARLPLRVLQNGDLATSRVELEHVAGSSHSLSSGGR
ncbi:hypothetical protein PR202_ga11854 [Eleusine coracana subsp. coracana]|uniref:Uncharacterized protein n=1 Tax=Eleusine coracana subsp. coracana TaxID=191504 RepID=A0AAV5CAP8_ELECO|nr:hypothetical protein PR202_ga11854 [Eleusine coracana subsp. coracana]